MDRVAINKSVINKVKDIISLNALRKDQAIKVEFIVEFLDNHRPQVVGKYMDLVAINFINMVDQAKLYQSRVTIYIYI